MKVNDLLKESDNNEHELDENQLGSVGGKLEDLIPGASIEVTSGREVAEDTYKVFFDWETGKRGEKHGRGSATFTCGFQTQGRHLVAVDFQLTDLTGIRGVEIDQSIFK